MPDPPERPRVRRAESPDFRPDPAGTNRAKPSPPFTHRAAGSVQSLPNPTFSVHSAHPRRHVQNSYRQKARIGSEFVAPAPGNNAPVATAPAAALPAFGARINTTSVPVTLSWSALDPDGDAIASYTLQQSTDGGSTWSTVGLPAATATSMTLNLGTVSNRAYRVRASDARGLAGGYAAAPAFAQTLTQEFAAAYAPSRAWSSSSVSGAYGGYVRRSQTANATATYTFTGSQIAWLATGSSNRGRAEIVLDGVSQGVVDLYSRTLLSRVVAFSKAVPAGTHTLQIKALGTRDPRASATYVDVDGFIVLR